MRDRDQGRERGGSQVNERARERDLQAHPNLIPRRCPIVLVATIAMKQRNNSNCSLFCKLSVASIFSRVPFLHYALLLAATAVQRSLRAEPPSVRPIMYAYSMQTRCRARIHCKDTLQ